ncbi:MFS transporter [Formosa sp. 3Alg 14/1]|uniref:MFS transporter n=1 Tax=Formosa sp. 3Alg 14/1 TaxID=3382190 RepID=UPI0039BDF93E
MSVSNKFSFINPNKFPFFYGYIVLFIGSIGVLASIPGQTVGVSVFTDPVKDALGLSRNQFSNAYMFGTLLSAFFVSKAGILFDRFGARYVAFFATLVFGISLMLCAVSVQISEGIKSMLNVTTWIVPFGVMCILFFFIRFSGQGVLTMASRNMIMLWFDKNRGKVNAISSVTVSLGFSSSPLVLNYLIERHGWERSWQILAVCLFIFSFCILQLYRNKPEDFNMVPDGVQKRIKKAVDAPKKVLKDFTLDDAKKTRGFWMFGLTLAFNSFFATGFTFHVVSIFETQGYDRAHAIAIFIPISIIALSVSTLCNILSDYINHKIYLYAMLGAGVLASCGLLFLSHPMGVYALVAGLGLLSGLFAVINAVTWPRYYGRLHLGAITGKVMSFLVIASAVAPSLFSYCFSTFGSYSYLGYMALAYLLFLILGSLVVKNPQ